MTRRAILMVTAGAAAIFSAISRAVASSSSGATIRETTPWASASSALIARPVSTMSVTTPWPHIWKRRPTPPVSGMTPWVASGSMKRAPSAAMRMSQSSARWNEPPIAQPWMATMIGASMSKICRMPRWPRRHQLVVGHLDLVAADGADVAARRPRLALAPPDDGPHVRLALQLAEDLEQGEVHLVVEGVVLLGVVVGDDGDRAVVSRASPVRRASFPLVCLAAVR